MEEEDNCKKLHARNGREVRLPELPRFSVDGYCTETRTVYELMGCFFHGCVKCQPSRDLKTLGEDTLAERYERKMARLELITNAGYTVKVMWECEFQESRITEMKPHLLTHPLLTHSPQHTRDALYGGRTEAMSLRYKVEENRETIQYCDVIVPVYLQVFKIPH